MAPVAPVAPVAPFVNDTFVVPTASVTDKSYPLFVCVTVIVGEKPGVPVSPLSPFYPFNAASC